MNHPKNDYQAALARRDDLVVQELPDEVLVYDLKRHKAHCLNQTAAFVWNHCDGRTTAADIAVLMAEEWSKPVSEEVVWLALKQLSRAELLREPVVANGDGMRASRRSVLRKLGAAAAMTPLVISLVAPTASAGASIPPICQSCRKKSDGACPDLCTETILGTCYDNAGCGAGQAVGCVSCQTCFAGGGGTAPPHLTISWEAPGVIC